jgi:hypothetical protein
MELKRFFSSAMGRGACVAMAALALPLLASCSGDSGPDVKAEYPTDGPFPKGTLAAEGRTEYYDNQGLFGGNQGFVLLGESGANEQIAGAGAIGVNSYLWRGALDTLSFLPLAQADPFGGVIITDWYTPAETPNERFKVTALILDRTLRADGIRVSAFRQVQQSPGNWVDAAVTDSLAADLENTILTRARQLRISNLASQ